MYISHICNDYKSKQFNCHNYNDWDTTKFKKKKFTGWKSAGLLELRILEVAEQIGTRDLEPFSQTFLSNFLEFFL